METFRPGDRVVAINTDHSRPICGPANPGLHPFTFPDGRLRKGPIYHVASVGRSRIGKPTLWITGLRVFWGNQEMPWDGTRFRKVDALKDFPKAKRRRTRSVAAITGRQAIQSPPRSAAPNLPSALPVDTPYPNTLTDSKI